MIKCYGIFTVNTSLCKQIHNIKLCKAKILQRFFFYKRLNFGLFKYSGHLKRRVSQKRIYLLLILCQKKLRLHPTHHLLSMMATQITAMKLLLLMKMLMKVEEHALLIIRRYDRTTTYSMSVITKKNFHGFIIISTNVHM